MSNWCTAGAIALDPESNTLLVQCKGSVISEDDANVEDYGQAPIMCALGVTAAPYQATPEGAVEMVVETGISGIDGVIIAARDTRNAAIVGALKPGDTVVHTTGPKQSAQLQLKEEKQIAALLTKDGGKKTMAVILDGTNNKLQITARGALFEIDDSGDVSITGKGGAGIMFKGDKVHFGGTVNLGAGNPPGFTLMASPVPSPGGPASVPLVQVMGVAIGFVAWTLCTLFGIPFRMVWLPSREMVEQ